MAVTLLAGTRGAKGTLWRKIVASALGVEIARLGTSEGAAFGAALLAGVSAGTWPDVATACDQTVSLIGRDSPDPDWAAVYAGRHELYRAAYPALTSTFHALAR